MSILDSIKGTRKMSFNHWRYRLLHWCFNVKNPDPNNLYATGLPKFLYTHFCPLFHLTNLIAILSPFILFIKVTCVVVGAVAYAFKSVPWDKIGGFLSSTWAAVVPQKKPGEEKPKPAPVVDPAVLRARERRFLVDTIVKFKYDAARWESFWCCNGNEFKTLLEAEVKKLYEEYVAKVEEARKRREAKQKAIRDKLIFWTNFSRVFIKWALNIFYVCLALAALYLVVLAVPYVWEGLCWFGNGVVWLFSDHGSLETLLFIGKLVLYAGIVTGGIVVLARIGFIQKFWEGLCHGWCKLTDTPFAMIGRFFAWVGSGFTAIGEFCKMFYEENCPPIVLISPEDAAVEAVAEGEDPSEKGDI